MVFQKSTQTADSDTQSCIFSLDWPLLGSGGHWHSSSPVLPALCSPALQEHLPSLLHPHLTFQMQDYNSQSPRTGAWLCSVQRSHRPVLATVPQKVRAGLSQPPPAPASPLLSRNSRKYVKEYSAPLPGVGSAMCPPHGLAKGQLVTMMISVPTCSSLHSIPRDMQWPKQGREGVRQPVPALGHHPRPLWKPSPLLRDPPQPTQRGPALSCPSPDPQHRC